MSTYLFSVPSEHAHTLVGCENSLRRTGTQDLFLQQPDVFVSTSEVCSTVIIKNKSRSYIVLGVAWVEKEVLLSCFNMPGYITGFEGIEFDTLFNENRVKLTKIQYKLDQSVANYGSGIVITDNKDFIQRLRRPGITHTPPPPPPPEIWNYKGISHKFRSGSAIALPM